MCYTTNICRINYNWILLFSFVYMCFCRNRFLIFYLFFEFSSIPILGLIVLFGQGFDRFRASLYLILYIIVSSFPLLVVFVKLYSIGIVNFSRVNFNTYRVGFGLISILPFLVKLPCYSLHL